MIFKDVKDHYEIFDFYKSRGIEMTEDNRYPREPLLFSIKMLKDGELLGAVTVYQEGEDYVVDSIAIRVGDTRKKYGTQLLNVALSRIKGRVFVIAKEPKFFEANDFRYVDPKDAPPFPVCFTCPDYNVTCFPKTMRRDV